jgi:hypothetical protein
MVDAARFYPSVPRDPAENLRWRVRMRNAALYDMKLQAVYRQAAFTDPLFWFAGFCWAFEPRATAKILPFVPWPHQEPAILAIDKAITDSEQQMEEPLDVVVDKSRAQGATWICLLIILRRFLRDELFSAGIVTRNMDLCDASGDPDSLFWKLQWALDRLPFWMLPTAGYTRLINAHSFANNDNGASIVGYAATGDVGSGGRKTCFMFDELAKFPPADAIDAMNSTQHVTNVRLFPSTYKGDSGVYYDMATGENNSLKIVLDWKDNPVQNKLAYRIIDSQCVPEQPAEAEAVRGYWEKNQKNIARLQRRGFIKHGKFRSPWYDWQCLRPGATPRGIAQELDRDPRGSVGKLISGEILDRMREKCQPPLWQGRVAFDAETLEITGMMPSEQGPLKLWFKPGIDHAPPLSRYVIGGDIAMGTGGAHSSNSSLVGINEQTGEQVLEYTNPNIQVQKFSRLSCVLAKWLYKAFLIWEETGPGGSLFSKEVLDEIYYPNVYYRDVEEIGTGKKTRKAGWSNRRKDSKADLFEVIGCAMDDGLFIPRSEDLVRELGEYEWDGINVIHKSSNTAGETGGAHADRAIAGGVAWLGCKDHERGGVDKIDETPQDLPYGSLAWILDQQAQKKREQEEAYEGGEIMTARDYLNTR